MIKDSVANRARYQGISPAFDVAFTFLSSFDAKALQDGRVDLEAGVFANVQTYVPVSQDKKQFEQHFDYADVQFVVEGSEILVEAPVDPERYRALATESDCALSDQVENVPSVIHLNAGDFCIVWPGEAHKPGLADGIHRGSVRKIVVKVPVARGDS